MANPLGSTPGIIVGVAVGGAAAAAVEPALERPRQDAWRRNPVRELDPGTIARLVAQGGIALDATAYDAARAEGYDTDKLDALVYLSQTVPGFAESLALWRRNPQAFTELWHHALTKQGLDQRYVPFLDELAVDRLAPPVIALAIVRGIIDDPGFLPVAPPTGAGTVPAFPTSSLDAIAEARAHGFDRDRLFVETAIAGRPMAPEAAAHAVFRGIIEDVDYRRAVAEGDVRNEWAHAIFEASRSIESPADAAGLRLRGWITAAESYELGARWGATPATMDNLFLDRGRPATTHQVHIGYTRGGRLASEGDDERATFRRAVQESDIRPEWEPILWAQRYTYPSAFVTRALTQAGDLTQADAEQVLLFSGWEPTLAGKVAAAWAAPSTAKARELTRAELGDEYEGGYLSEADYRARLAELGYTGAAQDLEVHLGDARRVKKWREKTVDAIAKAYIAHVIDEPTARADLAAVGVVGQAADLLVPLWQLEQRVARKQLTAAQVKAAYVKGAMTHDDAVAALVDLGYTPADATTYLAT